MWPTLGSVVGGLFGFLGAWLVYRNARRTATTDGVQAFIDQIQEQLDKAEVRIEKLERKERLLLDYVGQLRLHIDSRSAPPPPVFPPGLLGGPGSG